jgi:hypothetical protein
MTLSLDRFPGRELLRHVLGPTLSASRFEIAPSATGSHRQRGCAIAVEKFCQFGLYDNSGSSRLHRPGMPLKDIDTCSANMQCQAGTQAPMEPPATATFKLAGLLAGIRCCPKN